jgi:transcriptional regulator with XRE-family HTH domain
MNPASLGIELRRARRAAGLTQVEIARRMRTSQPAIARAEAGWTQVPSLQWLERYSEAVGRPITLTIGAKADTAELARRADRVLGAGFEQNPWERGPSPLEVRSLNARGLTRERFRRRRRAAAARS